MTENKALVQVQQHLSRGGALCKQFNKLRMNEELDWRTEQAYALSILNDNAKLQRCRPESIGRSLLDLAVMGLSLSPALREAYLIPYKDNCTASPSYMGLEQIAYRTGMVETIQTNVVRAGDKFRDWTDDGGRHIQHVSCASMNAEVTHAYCIVTFISGGRHIEVMNQNDLRACRDAATKKNGGTVPFTWKGPFREEMYKKSVLRRAWKHLPRVRNPKLVAMMEAVDRTDPMEFTEHDPQVIDDNTTLSDQQIEALVAMMVEAGVPAKGHDGWLSALAKAAAYPDGKIRRVKLTDFDRVASMMKEGIEKWKTSFTSGASSSGQDDSTSQREVA